MGADDPDVVFVGGQSVERHIYDRGMRAKRWSQSDDIPTLAYQKPDADSRHVEAVEPRLNIEANVLGFLIMLPLKHALGDSRHCGVMTPLDGVERLGEAPVVVVNLRRPLGVRSPCIIPATVRHSSVIFHAYKRLISPHRFSMGIRSLHGLEAFPLTSPLRPNVPALIAGFGVDTGSERSAWFNAMRKSDGRVMGGKLISS